MGETQKMVINHFGIDWSAGRAGEDSEEGDLPDGETIAWSPTGSGGSWSLGS